MTQQEYQTNGQPYGHTQHQGSKTSSLSPNEQFSSSADGIERVKLRECQPEQHKSIIEQELFMDWPQQRGFQLSTKAVPSLTARC